MCDGSFLEAPHHVDQHVHGLERGKVQLFLRFALDQARDQREVNGCGNNALRRVQATHFLEPLIRNLENAELSLATRARSDGLGQ